MEHAGPGPRRGRRRGRGPLSLVLRRLAIVLVALALPLAACSGSDDGDDGGDRSSDTTAAAASDLPAGSTTVDTTFSGAGSDAFCRQIRTYAEGSRRLGEAANASVRTVFSDAARAVNESIALAPAEIKRDIEIVAEAFTTLVRELETVNYDFTRLPPAVALRFMSPELQSASTRVEAYARNVCGVAG